MEKWEDWVAFLVKTPAFKQDSGTLFCGKREKPEMSRLSVAACGSRNAYSSAGSQGTF